METALPTQQASARGTVTSWRILPLAMLVVALAHFNRISISVAGTEQIIPDDGVGKVHMGLVYSAFLVVYTLLMVPGGWFIDRFGPRAAWLGLGFGSAVFVALTGAVGFLAAGPVALFAGLLAVRCLLGASNAPLHPTGARLVANWVPHSGAALANGLITGAALVGITVTYFLFGWLIDAVGWRGGFLVTGGVTLLVALLWAAAGADYPRAPAGSGEAGLDRRGRRGRPPAPLLARLRAFLRLLSNRGLVCLTLAYGAFGYFQYLFFYWAEYYFEDVLELSRDDSRLCTSLLMLAMAAGMVLGGWLSDLARARLGPRRGLACVPVAALAVVAVLLPCGLLLRDPAAVVAVFALAMAAGGTVEGPSWTAALRIGGRQGGTAAAVMNTGGNAVGLLAPTFTPWIAEGFGWEAALGAAALACLAGAALWLPIDPAECLGEGG